MRYLINTLKCLVNIGETESKETIFSPFYHKQESHILILLYNLHFKTFNSICVYSVNVTGKISHHTEFMTP